MAAIVKCSIALNALGKRPCSERSCHSVDEAVTESMPDHGPAGRPIPRRVFAHDRLAGEQLEAVLGSPDRVAQSRCLRCPPTLVL